MCVILATSYDTNCAVLELGDSRKVVTPDK